jgi:lipopolysaccharide export system permease protein
LLFAVTTLTSLLLLNFISKKFGDLVGKGLPWDVIVKFFVLSIPFVFAMTLPMAVLIATLYAFSRLGADSEVTALMSCGVGTRQLLTPVLSAGLVLSLLMIGFNDQVLPRANHQLSGLMSSIQQKKPTLALKPQMLNEVSRGKLFMWVSRLDTRHNSMSDVTIYDLSQGPSRRTIKADSGLLMFAANEKDLLLTLFDGFVEETHTNEPLKFQRTFFRTNILKVVDVANQLVINEEGGFKSDREMTVCEMQDVIRKQRFTRDSSIRALGKMDSATARTFASRFGSRTGQWYCNAVARFLPPVAQAQGAPQQQPPAKGAPPQPPPVQGAPPQPPAIQGAPPGATQNAGRIQPRPPGARRASQSIRTRARAGVRPNLPIQAEVAVQTIDNAENVISRYDVEIQKKFAISLACLIFALLGPPIALRFPRSGVGLTIGVSLAAFALYYVGLIAGESLADNGKVSPVVAMWAANAILGTIGITLALRMGRGGASARSGGWREFFGQLLPRRRPRSPA